MIVSRWLRLALVCLIICVVAWILAVALPIAGPIGSVLYIIASVTGALAVIFFLVWLAFALLGGRDRVGGRGPLV